MFASLVSDLFNDPTRLKILSVTSKEPKSAREIARMFSIPLGRCYRKIKKLEEDGLLAVVDREPTEDGKRQNVYLSQVKMVSINYEIGRLTVRAVINGKAPLEFVEELDQFLYPEQGSVFEGLSIN
jgi:DNA-binding transcriptional ArsR family regulator